jgi:hypothetical protein
MPAPAAHSEVLRKYIRGLLRSGWTIEQIQDRGISVEEYISVTSSPSVVSTVSTTTEYSTSASTVSTTPEYSTFVSTVPEYSTSTEYIPVAEYSTSTAEYSASTIEYSTSTAEYSTNTEAISELVTSTLRSVSNIVSSTLDQVVTTTANIAENVSEQFIAKRGNVSNESDSNFQLGNSISVEYISARNITQVADLGADTQGSSIEADQLYSGLRWLLQEWLPRQLDVVTLSEGGSHVLPSTELWDASDSARAEIESDTMSVDRELPGHVTSADLSLYREPLFLTLLAAVVLILGKQLNFQLPMRFHEKSIP